MLCGTNSCNQNVAQVIIHIWTLFVGRHFAQCNERPVLAARFVSMLMFHIHFNELLSL